MSKYCAVQLRVVRVAVLSNSTAAAGFVFNKCSGWSGWSGFDGIGSAGVGDLLECEQSGDGLSWSPPAQPL